jgi:hypothetical protein
MSSFNLDGYDNFDEKTLSYVKRTIDYCINVLEIPVADLEVRNSYDLIVKIVFQGLYLKLDGLVGIDISDNCITGLGSKRNLDEIVVMYNLKAKKFSIFRESEYTESLKKIILAIVEDNSSKVKSFRDFYESKNIK